MIIVHLITRNSYSLQVGTERYREHYSFLPHCGLLRLDGVKHWLEYSDRRELPGSGTRKLCECCSNVYSPRQE